MLKESKARKVQSCPSPLTYTRSSGRELVEVLCFKKHFASYDPYVKPAMAKAPWSSENRPILAGLRRRHPVLGMFGRAPMTGCGLRPCPLLVTVLAEPAYARLAQFSYRRGGMAALLEV